MGIVTSVVAQELVSDRLRKAQRARVRRNLLLVPRRGESAGKE